MIERDKYFYIAVPREDFQEVKHTFYEAPSTFLKVYDGDIIAHLHKQVLELQKALEWYADELNYFDHTIDSDEGKRARTALQSIQGGDTQ